MGSAKWAPFKVLSASQRSVLSMTPSTRILRSGLCIFTFVHQCLSTRRAAVAVEGPRPVTPYADVPAEVDITALTKAELAQPSRNTDKESLAMLQQRAELQRQVPVEQRPLANQMAASQSGKVFDAPKHNSTRPQGAGVALKQASSPAIGKGGKHHARRIKPGEGKRGNRKWARKRREVPAWELDRPRSSSSSLASTATGAGHTSLTTSFNQTVSSVLPAGLGQTQRRESNETDDNVASVRLISDENNLTLSRQSTPQVLAAWAGAQEAAKVGGSSKQGVAQMNGLQLVADSFGSAGDSLRAPQDAIFAMIFVVGVMLSVACCLQEFESQDRFDTLAGNLDKERKSSCRPLPPSCANAAAATATPNTQTSSLISAPLALRMAGPLCKDVPLPEGEICFSVDIAKLEQASGFFDLCELSGRPLLRAAMHIDLNTGREAASVSTREDEVLGAILSAEQGADPHVLDVHCKTGEKFGEFKWQSGEFVLVCGDTDVLHVRRVATSGLLTIDAAQTGERLGSASVNENTVRQDHLFVRVSPGSDAVLILLCVFGVLLFGAPNAEG